MNPMKLTASRRRTLSAPLMLGTLAIAIVVVAGFSLTVGARPIVLSAVWHALVQYNPQDINELLVQTLRLPRVLMAMLCGASFAVAGALMQGLTRNPMAGPSVMGINAGATFGMAAAMIVVPYASATAMMLWAFGGAAMATAVVLGLAGQRLGKSAPVFMALAGTAVSAVLAALTQVLTVTFDVAQDASFWVAGGLSGIREAQVALLWPWTVIGLLGAISLAKSVTLLSFGEEMAIGLGGHLQRTRILVGLTVLLLCGSAVAVAGPIGFVGLVTPHWARRLVGSDYRWIVPTSALLGALLLLLADLVARTVAAPFEIPLGAVTALVGVPFFLYLLNRKGGAMR